MWVSSSFYYIQQYYTYTTPYFSIFFLLSFFVVFIIIVVESIIIYLFSPLPSSSSSVVSSLLLLFVEKRRINFSPFTTECPKQYHAQNMMSSITLTSNFHFISKHCFHQQVQQFIIYSYPNDVSFAETENQNCEISESRLEMLHAARQQKIYCWF